MDTIDSIQMPSTIGLRDSIGFAQRLSKICPASNFTFDFSKVRWVEPFGLLLTSCAIRNFIEANLHGSQIMCLIGQSNDSKAIRYAAHMGFFKSCNFDYGNQPGGSPGFTNIPISFKKISDLVTEANAFGSQMETIAQELTIKLIRPYSKELFGPVKYSFLEIIRNVVEHSESDEIGYCAQYLRNEDRVEIAIVDTGIGLRHSLERNPHLDIGSDGDALKYAVLPGVSGKMFDGVESNPNNSWENSGFGLYMNYRLCNDAGDFFICSGQKGLYRTVGAADNLYLDADFQGTILRLRLYPSRLSDENHVKLFNRYRLEGEEIARRSDNGANLTASKISGYLRENFQNLHGDIRVGRQVYHMHFGVGRVEDLIPHRPEFLALVDFGEGSRSKRIRISELSPYEGPPPEPFTIDDIPF